MKSYLPLLSLSIIFASCSATYKSGQTPDDVYFSPARPQQEYVSTQKEDDRQYQGSEDEYRDDRYLRMKVHNRRWSTLDDPYAYSYNYYPSVSYVSYSPWAAASYWNYSSLWNYYYNPYGGCHNVIITNPKSTVYNKPRSINLRVFDNISVPSGTNSNPKGSYKAPRTSSYNSDNYNYRNSGTNAGGFLRNIFGNSSGSSGSSSSGSVNSKSSSPSSGSSSSGSSGGGGSAPVRRF